jgi:hypothetical protein
VQAAAMEAAEQIDGENNFVNHITSDEFGLTTEIRRKKFRRISAPSAFLSGKVIAFFAKI